MSIIDAEVLNAIGARPTGLRSSIPLYMRVKSERTLIPGGPVVHRIVQRDVSSQQLAALVLEIPDFSKLRRYERKKETQKKFFLDTV